MNKLRKLIMGIVAGLAGVALAHPASAEVTVGGFMTQTIGYGDYSVNHRSLESIHFDTNAEIHFTATGVTDGGYTVKALVELEGHSGGDQIDDNWLAIEGNFGQVTLGGESGAASTHGGAGVAGGYGNMGYYDNTDNFTLVGDLIGPIGHGASQGIRYASPNLGGFSASVSYQPNGGDGPRSTGVDNDDKVLSAGANYSGSMGAMQLTIGGGVVTQDDHNDDGTPKDDTEIGFGTELGFGSSSVFLRFDRQSKVKKNWGLAYQFANGPLTWGIGYAQSTEEWGLISQGSIVRHIEAEVDVDDAETKLHSVVVGAKYSLGGGVSAGTAVAWGKVKGEGKVAGTNDKVTDDEDSVGIGAHIAFSF